MSANVINSSILLALTLAVGSASLIIQTYFWPRTVEGFFSGGWAAVKEIWRHVMNAITAWSPSHEDYKQMLFTRLSVTFVLMCALAVVILTTYDSVSSFWVYFVLYLGVVLLAAPILGHIVAKLFMKSQ